MKVEVFGPKRTTFSAGLFSRPAYRYLAAIGAVMLGFGLRIVLASTFGLPSPYLTIYPAVVFAALILGPGPGFLAAVLGALGCELWLLSPEQAVQPSSHAIARMVVLFITTWFLGWAGNRLHRAERGAAALFRSMSDGFFAVDGKKKLTWFNEPASKLFEPGVDELRSAKIDHVLSAHLRQRFDEAWNEVRRLRKPVRFELSHNGRCLDFHMDPCNGGVSVAFCDITERKRAENALKESERKLSKIFNVGAIGVELWQEDGRILDANDAFLTLLGYTRAELIDGKLDWRKATPPEYVELNEKAMRQMARGEFAPPFEKEYLRKDGTRVPALVAGSGLGQTETGQIYGVAFVVELTELNKAKEALRQMELKLEVAVNTAGMGIWEWDFSARTSAMCSHRCKELLNLAQNEQLSYKRFLKAVLPQDRQRAHQAIKRAIRETVPYELEFRVPANGTVRWLFSKGGVYFAAPHVPGRVTGTLQDVTLRKRAEEERARFKFITDNASDVCVLIDADGRFLYVNEAGWRHSGYTEQELLQKRVCDIDVLFDPHRFETLFEELRSGKRIPPFETVHRRKSGELVAVEISISKVEFEGTPYMFATARDITERKRAEKALRESEMRFRAMAETIPDIIFTNRADGWADYCSQRFYEYTGLPAGTADGFNWTTALHPDDAERATETWFRCIKLGRPYHSLYRLRGRDGRYRWYMARANPIRDATGKIVKWFGACTDVHELHTTQQALRNAKQQLARANRELEQTVHERTTQLQDTVWELEHLSYSIIHDLRAPLRAMRGFSEILLLGKTSPSEQRNYLQRIAAASERMDQLVTDALSYTQAVKSSFELEPVDAAGLLKEMILSYPAFQPPNAFIELREPIPEVMANAAGLTQCFSNLLNNAIKFVRPGEKPRIVVCAKIVDDRVRLCFEDNGIGIPKQYQHRIFEMFHRVNRDQEGTGVGLALVRKVAQRMNGEVGVESEPNKGSTFWLEFDSARREHVPDRANTRV